MSKEKMLTKAEAELEIARNKTAMKNAESTLHKLNEICKQECGMSVEQLLYSIEHIDDIINQLENYIHDSGFLSSEEPDYEWMNDVNRGR